MELAQQMICICCTSFFVFRKGATDDENTATGKKRKSPVFYKIEPAKMKRHLRTYRAYL